MDFIKNNHLIQYILIIIFLFVSINIINNSTCDIVKENIVKENNKMIEKL